MDTCLRNAAVGFQEEQGPDFKSIPWGGRWIRACEMLLWEARGGNIIKSHQISPHSRTHQHPHPISPNISKQRSPYHQAKIPPNISKQRSPYQRIPNTAGQTSANKDRPIPNTAGQTSANKDRPIKVSPTQQAKKEHHA